MTSKVEKVLSDALELPSDERAEVAVTLLESLGGDEEGRVDEAWAAEIKRRVDEVQSGKVKTIPWSEARRKILSLRDAGSDA